MDKLRTDLPPRFHLHHPKISSHPVSIKGSRFSRFPDFILPSPELHGNQMCLPLFRKQNTGIFPVSETEHGHLSTPWITPFQVHRSVREYLLESSDPALTSTVSGSSAANKSHLHPAAFILIPCFKDRVHLPASSCSPRFQIDSKGGRVKAIKGKQCMKMRAFGRREPAGPKLSQAKSHGKKETKKGEKIFGYFGNDFP